METRAVSRALVTSNARHSPESEDPVRRGHSIFPADYSGILDRLVKPGDDGRFVTYFAFIRQLAIKVIIPPRNLCVSPGLMQSTVQQKQRVQHMQTRLRRS